MGLVLLWEEGLGGGWEVRHFDVWLVVFDTYVEIVLQLGRAVFFLNFL